MTKLRQTPSQTIGPFFAYGLTAVQYQYDFTSILQPSLVGGTGENIIVIRGQVFDGAGAVVNDAMIELLHADASGNYCDSITDPAQVFKGFGRCGTGTDAESRFYFNTIKPGAAGTGQAPHVHLILFMRGSLHQLYTRMYFSDEGEANAGDEFLNSLPPQRRQTLIAQKKQTMIRSSINLISICKATERPYFLISEYNLRLSKTFRDS